MVCESTHRLYANLKRRRKWDITSTVIRIVDVVIVYTIVVFVMLRIVVSVGESGDVSTINLISPATLTPTLIMQAQQI